MTSISTQERPKLHLFYRADREATQRAIDAKLPGAAWAVWSYLQLLDPFGNRWLRCTVQQLMDATGYDRRTIQRSLNRLRKEGLWEWRPTEFESKNPWGTNARSPNAAAQEKVANLPATQKTSLPQEPQAPPPEACNHGEGLDTEGGGKNAQTAAKMSRPGQKCPNGGKNAQSEAQNPDSTRVSNLSDLSDNLDPSDREDEDEEKINFSEEDLLPEEAIARIFGLGSDSLKRYGIFAYQRLRVEVIDRSTARIVYANNPVFLSLFAWARKLYAQHDGSFLQLVKRWCGYFMRSDRPIRNPYGHLRQFVANELEV